MILNKVEERHDHVSHTSSQNLSHFTDSQKKTAINLLLITHAQPHLSSHVLLIHLLLQKKAQNYEQS